MCKTSGKNGRKVVVFFYPAQCVEGNRRSKASLRRHIPPLHSGGDSDRGRGRLDTQECVNSNAAHRSRVDALNWTAVT